MAKETRSLQKLLKGSPDLKSRYPNREEIMRGHLQTWSELLSGDHKFRYQRRKSKKSRRQFQACLIQSKKKRMSMIGLKSLQKQISTRKNASSFNKLSFRLIFHLHRSFHLLHQSRKKPSTNLSRFMHRKNNIRVKFK